MEKAPMCRCDVSRCVFYMDQILILARSNQLLQPVVTGDPERSNSWAQYA